MENDIELTVGIDASASAEKIQSQIKEAILRAASFGQQQLNNISYSPRVNNGGSRLVPGYRVNVDNSDVLLPALSAPRSLATYSNRNTPVNFSHSTSVQPYWRAGDYREGITGERYMGAAEVISSTPNMSPRPFNYGLTGSKVGNIDKWAGAPAPGNDSEWNIPPEAARETGETSREGGVHAEANKQAKKYNDTLRSTKTNLGEIYRLLKSIVTAPWHMAIDVTNIGTKLPAIHTLGISTADRAYAELVRNVTNDDIMEAAANWQAAKGEFKLKGTGIDLLGEAFVGQFRSAMAESNPLTASWRFTQLAYDYLKDPNTDKDKLRAAYNMIPGGNTYLDIADKALTKGLPDVFSFTRGKYDAEIGGERQSHAEEVAAAFWPTKKNWEDLWADIAASFTEKFTIPLADFFYDTFNFAWQGATNPELKTMKAARDIIIEGLDNPDKLTKWYFNSPEFKLWQRIGDAKSVSWNANWSFGTSYMLDPRAPQYKHWIEKSRYMAEEWNKLHPGAKIDLSTWSHVRMRDIQLAMEANPDTVYFKYPAAEVELVKTFMNPPKSIWDEIKERTSGTSYLGKLLENNRYYKSRKNEKYNVSEYNQLTGKTGISTYTLEDIVDYIDDNAVTAGGVRNQWAYLQTLGSILDSAGGMSLWKPAIENLKSRGYEGFFTDNSADAIDDMLLRAVAIQATGGKEGEVIANAIYDLIAELQRKAGEELNITVDAETGSVRWQKDSNGSNVGTAASAARNTPLPKNSRVLPRSN